MAYNGGLLRHAPADEGLSAFVLAGGKSSRMGSDKAELRLSGAPLLEIATRKALALTPQVYVVGPKPKFGSEAIEDIFLNRGPLGGIHAALSASRSELNLMLAVDLPFVPLEFLQLLQQRSERSAALVVVPRTAHGWQPLCAIYKTQFRDFAEQALSSGHNKIDSLFASRPVEVLDESDLQTAGFTPAIFDNLNTPEDFAGAQVRFEKEKKLRNE